MKIIFSRKGFDQEYGGHPSPLAVGRKIQSFPIPSRTGIPYSDIYCEKGLSLRRMMLELGVKFNQVGAAAHLDPDIDPTALKKRSRAWRGAFGQAGAAQGHLANQGVDQGDLFLFFGWFRRAQAGQDGWRYLNRENAHVLFGYLMVDEVLKVGPDSKVPAWLKYHPHCDAKHRSMPNNHIYLAKKEIEPGLPGYGVFNFSENLVLTKKGYSRSRWDLPEHIFKELKISYHSPRSWKDGYFQSAAKGQEFVVEANKKARNWALNLLRKRAYR